MWVSGTEQYPGPLDWTANRVGFLLPVDSFEEFFDSKTDRARGDTAMSRRRADLLAVSVVFPSDIAQPLTIQALAVECKFSSNTYSTANVHGALGQAQITTDWFKDLCEVARQDAGMAERLGLLQMMWFGARLSGDGCDSRADLERRLYEAILSGHFQFKPAKKSAVLVSTETGLPGPAEMTFPQDGAWIRLNRQNWPGICDTSSVNAIRNAVNGLFDNSAQHITTAGSGAPDDEASSASTTPGALDGEAGREQAVESLRGRDHSGVTTEQPPKSSDEQPDNDGCKEQSREEPVEEKSRTAEPLGITVQKLLIGVDSSRREVYFDPHSHSFAFPWSGR